MLSILPLKPSTNLFYENKYWSGNIPNDWFNITDNWFTDSSLTTHATSLPNNYENAILVGSNAAYINVDNIRWSEPNLINSTGISDPFFINSQLTFTGGVLLHSNNASAFDGTIYGNVIFSGNICML